MASPKRHHYLPQFYLEYFCRDGLLWIYDREKDEFRQQSPLNTAIQGHYYSFEMDDGTKNVEIEKMLSEVETAAKPIIEKIEKRAQITPDDKESLAFFVYFFMTRGPSFEDQIGDMFDQINKQIHKILLGSSEEQTAAMIRQFEENTGRRSPMSAKEMISFVEKGEYDVVVHRNMSLKMMLELASEFASYFTQMEWLFLSTSTSSYITTDSPFMLTPPPNWKPDFFGFGLLTPGALKLIPITQKIALVILDRGDPVRIMDVADENVHKINLTLAVNSQRFVIATDEGVLRNLVRETNLANQKPRKRFEFR